MIVHNFKLPRIDRDAWVGDCKVKQNGFMSFYHWFADRSNYIFIIHGYDHFEDECNTQKNVLVLFKIIINTHI